MKVLITGGTGFIGSILCQRLLQEQHSITILSRTPEKIRAPLQAIRHLDQLNGSGFDVVINLAGESIADKRWSKKQKHQIQSSRLCITQQLISYFKTCQQQPELFISGSAVGYYGVAASEKKIEESDYGDVSFSSQLCQKWEAVALQAQAMDIRTCLLRTGIVLGEGGVLTKMLPPFKLGLGGRIGPGSQWMPWIHIQDLISIILYCINHSDLQGPVNATAPNPVSNRVFTKALARVLKRPALLPLPAFMIQLLMGEMGKELLLSGKKIVPAKMLMHGFKFEYEALDKALLDIL